MKREVNLKGYWFILPCFVLLLGVLGFPMVMALLNSFTPIWTKGLSGFTLAYYRRLFNDPVFFNSLTRTIYFVGATVILHLVLGLAVALALNSAIRARRFFRAIAILPWTVPDVIAGLVWACMYDPWSGLLNDLLQSPKSCDLSRGVVSQPELSHAQRNLC